MQIRRKARNRVVEERSKESEGGLNEDERREIEARIEELFTDRRLVPPASLTGKELKSGALFPLIVNLCVLALLAAGIWFLVLPSWSSETGPLATGEGFDTTEGFIVERVRERAQAELSERERRIAEIRRQLEELRGQEAATPGETQSETDERSEELQQELQRLLSEMEEARAEAEQEQQGISSAVEERLRGLERRQEEERFLLDQLGFTYQAVDQHLSEGNSDAAMAELDRADQFLSDYSADGSFANTVAILEQGNAALREALQLFENVTEADGVAPERLAAEQTEAERLAAERAEAEQAVARLEAQLEAARENAAQTEAELRAELAEARAALATARSALEEAERAQAPPEISGERSAELAARQRQIEALQVRVSSLERDLEGSSARVALLESRIDQRNSSVASLQSEVQQQLSAVRAALAREVSGAAPPSREEVEELLETKTLIREVLISDAVREDHPELYEDMERYLEELGNRRQGAGETQGLYAAVTALQELMEGIGIEPSRRVSRRSSRQELQAALTSELFVLIEGVLREAR